MTEIVKTDKRLTPYLACLLERDCFRAGHIGTKPAQKNNARRFASRRMVCEAHIALARKRLWGALTIVHLSLIA